MKGRPKLILPAALCAMAFTAVTASSAAANSTGYFCVAGGSGGEGTKYSDATCQTVAGGGAFGHGVIALNNPTDFTVARSGLNDILFKTKIGLAKPVLEAAEVECVSCTVENHQETVELEKRKELRSVAPFGHLRFTEVDITTPTCEVVGEEFVTKALQPNFFGETGATRMELAPASGTTFAEIPLKESVAKLGPCAFGPKITITGHANAALHGTIASLATGAGELLVGAQKVEMIGEAKMGAGEEGEPPGLLALTEA